MASRPLPLGSYQTSDLRASCKRLVGCFSEQADQDAPDDKRSEITTAWLRRMPGLAAITGFNDGTGLPVRGMWEMAGTEYVVIGPNLYSVTYDPYTNTAVLSAALNGAILISGFGFVRMNDNGACLVILEPGTANAWTYCPFASQFNGNVTGNTLLTVNSVSQGLLQVGQVVTTSAGTATIVSFGTYTNLAGSGTINITSTTNVANSAMTALNGFQTLSNVFFTAQGAIDLTFIDSYIVFLSAMSPAQQYGTAGNPTYGTMTFYNDDGRIVSGNTQITFTTAASFGREFGTDPFVGMIADHREVMIMGARSTEGYINAGNPTGSPFASAPDSFMPIGCHYLAAYSIAAQDQAYMWVANDLTVRRRNGQTPMRISNSGIEDVLSNGDLTGCYALTPTVYGHPLWILTMPQWGGPGIGRTIAYDCLTTKWFELQSGNLGNWRPLCYHNGLGLQLIGDGQSSAVGTLNETNFLEFGSTQLVQFVTQAVYDKNNRFTERRIDCVVTMGGSPSATYSPIIDLYLSDNSGKTFYSVQDPQTLGTQGQDEGTGQRAVWFNQGQGRNRVHMFQITDATPLFGVDIQVTLEGGGELVNM